MVSDVVFALTIAYDILVGGLPVAIIGGLAWAWGVGSGAGGDVIYYAATRRRTFWR
ncbi:hypothetical protein [Arthrobacter dokdonensis]|uniref:hypothetical protein n=1 Tax=Arthrobacter dokdonellae TaxID=2211210 RepID=UPI0014946E4D|nr:hypothetical protein [Arthrobacter dokdonellae]